MWDSGLVTVALALIQDNKVDLPQVLAKAFGVRIARGLGANLIAGLLADSDLGATAAGDPVANGANGQNSIGYADLLALRKSINPAYRASGKSWFLMNDDTLTALDALTDKNLRPLLHPVYVGSQRMLLGYPVGICPSMPDIGSGQKPILFGATGYHVIRLVTGESRLVRLFEAPGFVEHLSVGFKSYLRANGMLLLADAGSPVASSSPVRYLQNAA